MLHFHGFGSVLQFHWRFCCGFTWIQHITGFKQLLIISFSLKLAMKLRWRGTWSKLEDDGVLLQDTTTAEERSSGNTLSRVKCFKVTGRKEKEEGKGCPGKVPLLEGFLSALGSSLSSGDWQRGLTVASGLLVALLLALTQAYWVNSIHENLLWFSHLTVRTPWTHFFGTKQKFS